MKRNYHFQVCFGEGRYANGEYIVCADDEAQATDMALQEICHKLNYVLPDLDIEVSVNLTKSEHVIFELMEDCFHSCRECDDCYNIKVDEAHCLFILVQENPDYNDGILEYFFELNETSSGSDEPCAKYNVSCSVDNFDEFKNVITNYLSDNEININ